MTGFTHTGKRDEGLGKNPGHGFLMPDTCITLHKLANILSSAQAFLPYLLIYVIATACMAHTEEESTVCRVYMTKGAEGEMESLDLFFYESGEDGHLDAYQRFDIQENQTVAGSSRTGTKTVVGICNMKEADYSWSDICSLSSLEQLKSYLDEDDPDRPVMSAVTKINAGSTVSCSMVMRPVMSEVVLRSVRCDFSSRSYKDERLEDVCVYLTNVCSAWPVLKDTLGRSSDYINIGRLDKASMDKLVHPEYIYQEIRQPLGTEATMTDIHLYCYPNVAKEESLGSPFTRLVIEGTLEGKRYYYPLNVNRRRDECGIERNSVYILDVVLTRRGTTDPDTAVDTDIAQVNLSIEDWDEKEKQNVTF